MIGRTKRRSGLNRPATAANASAQEVGNSQDPETSFPRNLALLALILDGDYAGLVNRLQREPGQVAGFADFIHHHRLQLLVFSLLAGSPARNSLPVKWLEELKLYSVKHWITHERRMHELMRISALLAAEGHEFILLKGPYLAVRFFGGIDRREYWDLDLLIKREHVPEVEHLLRGVGFVRKSKVLINAALTTRFTHAFDFAKSDVALDLHWRLSANAAHNLDDESIWRQRQTFVLRNHTFSVLSDEHEVMFNLISIFKDLDRGAGNLKSFVDLYFILASLSRVIEWEAFFANRRREKTLRISVNVLALFFELFHCRHKFPEAAEALARERRHIKPLPSSRPHALIEGRPGALKNKAWAAGIYECSRLHLFFWWLLSLPFRLAVHDSGRYARLKNRLQRARGHLTAKALGRRARDRN